MIDWLNAEYPNIDFSYQCFLLNNNIIPDKCPICGNIPNKGKQTCSRTCREQYKKSQGIDSFAKMKAAMFEKYGVDNPAKVKAIQQKRIDTNIKKYGSAVSDLTKQKAKDRAGNLNTKGRATLKQRYGVDNPGQLQTHCEESKQTLIKNYGVDNYFSSEDWKTKSFIKQIDKIDQLSDMIILDIIEPDISLSTTYDNPNRRIEFKCPSCSTIEIIPFETFKYRLRQFQTPCGQCANITSPGSSAQSEIAKFIRECYNGTILQNDRTLIAPKEIDIYLPDIQLGIEYCGLYWHNDNRINKNYHYDKMIKCNTNNIQLITIFEDEWIHKKDIVKQRLRHKLGLVTTTIHGRKCTVGNITSGQARDFVSTHHIQGYVNASTRYGMFFENELIAVMTFSKSNVSKGNAAGYELSRFCIKGGIRIHGAASKLFKQFIIDCDPKLIFTYSDLRWNDGSVYEQLGFEFDKFTGLNYWYIEGNKRHHRFKLRKQKSDSRDISESILRKSQGWLRIWDCGNEKYVWKNDTYLD